MDVLYGGDARSGSEEWVLTLIKHLLEIETLAAMKQAIKSAIRNHNVTVVSYQTEYVQ